MLREILSVLVLNPFILSSNGVRGGENVGSVPAHQNDWYTGQYTNSIPAYSPPSSAYSGGQALARDSYAEAAASSGGTDLGHAQATKYHYQMFPSDSHHQQQYGAPMQNYGTPYQQYGEEDEFSGNSGGGGSGALGLLGLLGLKGLKGVKAVAPFVFPFLIPLLLPLILLPLLPIALPLLLLLLFVPVPVITVPTVGRLQTTARELKELALAEDCIERISCEATRFARNYGFNPTWVQEFLEKSSSTPGTKWVDRISKGIQSSDCQKFTCSPSTVLRKSLISVKQAESASVPSS